MHWVALRVDHLTSEYFDIFSLPLTIVLEMDWEDGLQWQLDQDLYSWMCSSYHIVSP